MILRFDVREVFKVHSSVKGVFFFDDNNFCYPTAQFLVFMCYSQFL
jgi:hypothetical protein